MKAYYEDAAVTLYHGDALKLLPQIMCAANVVVADPPYGQTSLKWDRWPTGWIDLIRDQSMWVFGSMRMFLEHRAEFAAADFAMSQDLVWEKHNGSSFHADRFRRVHEHILHWYRGDWASIYKSPVTTPDATARTVRRKQRPAHMGHIEAGSYESHDGGPRLMRSVIYERSCHGTAINETQKPVPLVLPLIEYSCPPGGIVVDPFAGSGTTLIAARDLGRRAIGIELREDQCEKAAERLSQIILEFARDPHPLPPNAARD